MVNPNELTLKEQTKNLSEEEKRAMDGLEAHIDHKIKENFNNGRARVLDFWWEWDRSDLVKPYMSLRENRQRIVREALFEKYRENGWKVEIEYGEDDGPNRPGIDSFIFTAK